MHADESTMEELGPQGILDECTSECGARLQERLIHGLEDRLISDIGPPHGDPVVFQGQPAHAVVVGHHQECLIVAHGSVAGTEHDAVELPSGPLELGSPLG